MSDEKRYSIGDLAVFINRSETTIRSWCRTGRLPEHLRPSRVGPVGWRYWTEKQVHEIKEWMVTQRMFPGGGLKHYHPNQAEVNNVLDRLRSAKEKGHV